MLAEPQLGCHNVQLASVRLYCAIMPISSVGKQHKPKLNLNAGSILLLTRNYIYFICEMHIIIRPFNI